MGAFLGGNKKNEISGATLFAQSCSRCVKYKSTMTVSGAASNVCFGSSSEVVVNPLRVREIVVRRFERNKKSRVRFCLTRLLIF
jgi:hypothetical protein